MLRGFASPGEPPPLLHGTTQDAGVGIAPRFDPLRLSNNDWRNAKEADRERMV